MNGGTRRRSSGARQFLYIVALWLVLWWSIIGAAVAPMLLGGWFAVFGIAALTTLPLAVIFERRRAGRYPGALSRLLLLRPFVYVQLVLPLLAAGTLVGAVIGALAGEPALGARRAQAIVGAGYALFALFGFIGSRRLVAMRIVATWPDLPPGLDGLRIVQISDTHIGPQTSRRHLANIARLVREAEPELIAVTGDLIDDHADDVAHYAAALGALQAPLGVYAIPGNHDVYARWPAVRDKLAELPMTVLVNDARVLTRKGDRFVLLGTGDPAGGGGGSETGGPDLERAFAVVPAGAFIVALAHNPALWPELARRGARLTLSGHTHWGQLAIPGLGWSLASPFNAYAMGSYASGDALLYVHPGSNFWGIPFRLGTPPEVAIVELRRRAAVSVDRFSVR